MEQEQKIPQRVTIEPVKFEWVIPKEGAPELYGNFYHVSWTLFDVRFQIGQLIPKSPDPGSGFFVDQRGSFTMAWPEAKALRDSLVDVVARYEKANGELKPINLPGNTPIDSTP